MKKTVLVILSFLFVVDYASAQHPGDLDSAFAINATNVFPAYSLPYCMTLLPDGNTVVAATINGEFALVKYLPNGLVDPAFGYNGVVGYNNTFLNASRATCMLNDTAGRIVIAMLYTDTTNSTHFYFAIVRFLPNGLLDPSFGSSGISYDERISYYESLTNITVQSDGKYIVYGASYADSTFVRRYNSNGSPDSGFCSCNTGKRLYGNTLMTITSNAIVHADGKITVGGYVPLNNPSYANATYCALVQYNSDGSIDTSFGYNGLVMLTSIFGQVNNLYLLNNGNIILAGPEQSSNNNQGLLLARYTSAGVIDTSFGTRGFTATNINGSDIVYRTMGVQANGAIVLTGEMNNDSIQCTARYNANGIRDNSFGTNGVALTQINNAAVYFSMIQVRTNGDILVCGYSIVNYDRITLSQYLGYDNTGINKVLSPAPEFTAYPNPSLGIFNVTSGTNTGEACVRLRDITGRQLFSFRHNFSSPLRIDLNNYPSGVYTVDIAGDGFVACKKLFKQ